MGNNRIVVLGFDGMSFSYLEAYSAELNGPMGVAVDGEDHIYIADTGNNRIVVLGADGSFLQAYTAPNDGSQGGFSQPRGLAVREDGVMLVADTGNARVVRVYMESPLQVVLLPLVARMGY